MSFVAAAATASMIAGGAKAVGGLAKLGMSLAGRKKRIREQKAAKKEMEAKKAAYEALDTSNTFKNKDNNMDDMTVDQRAAQFAAQEGAKQRANIMQQMSGAAGSSGIASLAQAMANEGQLAAQKAAADIGKQERENQKLASQEASKIQELERRGEQVSQERTMAKTGTLLGMAQQRLGAANQARAMPLKNK